MTLYLGDFGNTVAFPKKDFVFYLDSTSLATSKRHYDKRLHELYSDEVNQVERVQDAH